MNFVDFNISTERKVDSINADNVYEINAYFCRGHYEDRLNEITNVTESVYVRDERWKKVTIIFLPDLQNRNEIMENLYDMLLDNKEKTDEVIPECVF